MTPNNNDAIIIISSAELNRVAVLLLEPMLTVLGRSVEIPAAFAMAIGMWFCS